MLLITLPTTVMRVFCFYLRVSVCLSVVLHDVSKTVAARITGLDIEMFHDES